MITRMCRFVPGVSILLCLCHIGALADTLRGRVTDPAGGVVARAEIRLFDRNTGQVRRTVTAPDGTYEFSQIPPGIYLIEGDTQAAALSGSAEVTVSGIETYDLDLEVSATRVEVFVTASGTSQSIEETAKAIDVVTADDIALRNEFLIGEAVRSVPGVRVQVQEGPGSLTTIQTRGLRIYDTAVLLDGMRFRDAASPQGDATAFLETMATVDTDRIEFLRGSGSSLYGSHAMGGVLNVTSRPGGGPHHGELRLEGGGLGLMRGVAGVAGGVSGDRLAYSGTVSHINVTRGVRDGNPYRNTSPQGSVRYDVAPGISVTGRAWYASDYLATTENPAFPAEVLANFPDSGPVRAIPLPTDQLELFEQHRPFNAGDATFVPGQTDRDGRRVGSFLSGSIGLDHEVSPSLSYRVRYQIVDTRRDLIDGPAGGGDFEPLVGTASRFDGRTDTLQVRADGYFGDHQFLTGGYEFERDEYVDRSTDDGPVPTNSQVKIDQSSHSLFVQDQLRLFDSRLQLSLGGRVQLFDLATPSYSGAVSPYETTSAASPPGAYTGDAAVAYFFASTETKIRAHVGNSYRAPSSFERFGGSFSSFTDTFDYWGDPRLAPERSVAFDAGIDQWLFRSRLQLNGTFFYTNLQNTILFDFATFPVATDPFGRFGGYRNGSGGIARGGEIGARFSPSPSTLVQAGYTYTNSDSRTPTIGTDFFSTLGVSDHMLTLTATQWITNRFNVTFDMFTASDYHLSPFGADGRDVIFNGPVKADIVARYDFAFGNDRTAELYVKVENLLDRHDYEDGFLGPGAWSIAGFRILY